jgi:maleylacetate reductase
MPSINFTAWPEKIIVDEPVGTALARDMERRGVERACLLISASLNRDRVVMRELTHALGSRLTCIHATIPQHSPLPAVLEAAAQARRAHADALISIGGGSVIDATKVVQKCLSDDLFDETALLAWRNARERGDSSSKKFVPHLCVPTTLSGAEFTCFAGIRNPVSGLKDAFFAAQLLPRTLIFDAALSRRTPETLWLSSGVRALDHAIEGICSLGANPFADTLALAGIARLVDNLTRTKAAPADLSARRESQVGSWFAAAPLMSAVSMGASHAIGHALGSLLDVPHGITSCVVLPAVMQFNHEAIPGRFQCLAAALGGACGAEAPELLRRFLQRLGLPTTLSQIGVGRDSFRQIARGALQETWIKTNPRPIRGEDDVMEILAAAE